MNHVNNKIQKWDCRAKRDPFHISLSPLFLESSEIPTLTRRKASPTRSGVGVVERSRPMKHRLPHVESLEYPENTFPAPCGFSNPSFSTFSVPQVLKAVYPHVGMKAPRSPLNFNRMGFKKKKELT